MKTDQTSAPGRGKHSPVTEEDQDLGTNECLNPEKKHKYDEGKRKQKCEDRSRKINRPGEGKGESMATPECQKADRTGQHGLFPARWRGRVRIFSRWKRFQESHVTFVF